MSRGELVSDFRNTSGSYADFSDVEIVFSGKKHRRDHSCFVFADLDGFISSFFLVRRQSEFLGNVCHCGRRDLLYGDGLSNDHVSTTHDVSRTRETVVSKVGVRANLHAESVVFHWVLEPVACKVCTGPVRGGVVGPHTA